MKKDEKPKRRALHRGLADIVAPAAPHRSGVSSGDSSPDSDELKAGGEKGAQRKALAQDSTGGLVEQSNDRLGELCRMAETLDAKIAEVRQGLGEMKEIIEACRRDADAFRRPLLKI
ncbi:MAG: hypothetical protein LC672_00695 [Acidobacteria bacterium]|nr:hypothetical protein [Acidobacteriota bacterium]